MRAKEGKVERKVDCMRYCTVMPAGGDQWAVWGALEWTDAYKRQYAICPSKDAAEAARRLLSGDAARSRAF